MNTSANPPFDFDVSAWPALPELRGLLVTGTDTEVGKTLVAGAIARSLRAGGTSVDVFKPVATGCRSVRGDLVSADAEFLAVCADSPRSLSEIAPVRYSRALAPNVAAEREGRPVDLDSIFHAYRRLEGQSEAVIVEGIGGLLCPITDDFWVIHFAKLLSLPVVIVARAELGTINHTLLTIHAARCAGLEVAGVVINRFPPELIVDASSNLAAGEDGDLATLTNPAQIAARGGVEILAIIPNESANCVEQARLGPDTLFAASQVDWLDLC